MGEWSSPGGGHLSVVESELVDGQGRKKDGESKERVRSQDGADEEASGRERGICTHWAVMPGQTSVFYSLMNGSDGLQNTTHAAIGMPMLGVIKFPHPLRTGILMLFGRSYSLHEVQWLKGY